MGGSRNGGNMSNLKFGVVVFFVIVLAVGWFTRSQIKEHRINQSGPVLDHPRELTTQRIELDWFVANEFEIGYINPKGRVTYFQQRLIEGIDATDRIRAVSRIDFYCGTCHHWAEEYMTPVQEKRPSVIVIPIDPETFESLEDTFREVEQPSIDRNKI